MGIQPLVLGSQSNIGRDPAISAASLTNCYVEVAGDGAKMQFPIVASDGFAAWATMTGGAAGVIRGMLNLNETTLYVVTGTRLQSVTTSAGVTHLAELATSGIAYMARNRRGDDGTGYPQVGIVTSDGLFRIIENNVVSTPSLDPDLPSSLFNSICHLDGYFVITLSNGEFYISSIDAGSDVDVLDFASAQSNPDGLSRGLVRGRELVLMGPRSTEFWQNTGATDFPFERAQAVDIGIYAPASAVSVVAVVDSQVTDSICWASSNNQGDYIGVMMLGGYDARKISTSEVDRAIRGESNAANVRAFQYARDDGTAFYVITGTAFTYEFNLRTQLWHQRKSSGLDKWKVTDAAQFGGYTVFGDYSAASLYRRNATQTPASASSLTMRQSKDHGDSWTTARSASIGIAGQRKKRVKFTRLGSSAEDGTVFELAITNAVIEAGTGNSMTVVTPAVHTYPGKVQIDALYVDTIPGGSLASRPKALLGGAVNIQGLVA